MKTVIRLGALGPCVVAMAAMVGGAEAGTLEVRVLDVKQDQGQVLVALCAASESLGHCKYRASAPATRGEVRVTVAYELEGEFALWVLHDLDGDKQLSLGPLGLPAEPVAFGNDARMRFGPPAFKQAAVRLDGQRTALTVRLRHR